MRRLVYPSLILLLMLGAAQIRADSVAPSLLDYELRSLAAPDVHSLLRYRGKPVLMVFFEPECTWCFRQVRAINALGKGCAGTFTALAVGVNGSRESLRKELRRLKPDFPAYQASAELMASLGGVPATPLTLLGDTRGGYLSWLSGYAPEDRLADFMRTGGASCPT